MKKTLVSRILLILLGLLVLVVLFAIISMIGRAIFSSEDSPDSPISDSPSLLTNTVDMSVEMTIRGPIVADENFQTIQFEISSSKRQIARYSGYSLTEIDSSTSDNTFRAYDEFIHALNHAGFTKGTASSNPIDTRGLCATGKLYEFRVKQSDETIQEFWTSSCKNVKGTSTADLKSIYHLFSVQLPESSTILTNF